MAVISVRLNEAEERIVNILSEQYDKDKSSIIKYSLNEMYEDLMDRKIIEEYESKEKGTKFISAEEILKSLNK